MYKKKAFCELINYPIWTCYATSLNSAQAWKFSQTELGDSATGFAQPTKNDKISDGVVASACLSPLFRPFIFNTHGKSFVFKYVNGKLVNTPNQSPPERILLTDGGVYDNLGSESVITKRTPFIVSDASGIAEHWRQGYPNKLRILKRPIDISMDQIGKLRRRILFQLLEVNNSVLVEASKPLITYTTKEVPDLKSPTPPERMPPYPSIHRDLEKAIGSIRTDLNAFHDYEIYTLIWNGMVKIDAVLKRWCPNLIKEEYWSDVPKLVINNITEAIEMIQLGSEMKIWGELHKKLHKKVKLVDSISNILEGLGEI